MLRRYGRGAGINLPYQFLTFLLALCTMIIKNNGWLPSDKAKNLLNFNKIGDKNGNTLLN